MKQQLPQELFPIGNPYHDRLAQFDHLVFRDQKIFEQKGRWNQQVFGRTAPLHLELGCGHGEFMIELCQRRPEINFIGIDYRFKRSFHLAQKLHTLAQCNFRLARISAYHPNQFFADNELDELYLFFPDPWPKQRHHKKRIFTLSLLSQAFALLKPHGRVYIKTDHDDYFEWMQAILLHPDQRFFQINYQTTNLWADATHPFLTSFRTKFEKLFMEKGVKIKALELQSLKL